MRRVSVAASHCYAFHRRPFSPPLTVERIRYDHCRRMLHPVALSKPWHCTHPTTCKARPKPLSKTQSDGAPPQVQGAGAVISERCGGQSAMRARGGHAVLVGGGPPAAHPPRCACARHTTTALRRTRAPPHASSPRAGTHAAAAPRSARLARGICLRLNDTGRGSTSQVEASAAHPATPACNGKPYNQQVRRSLAKTPSGRSRRARAHPHGLAAHARRCSTTCPT